MVLHITPTCYPAACWGGPVFSVYTLNILAALPDVELDVLTTDSAGLRVADRLDNRNLEELNPNQEVIITLRIWGTFCVTGGLMKQVIYLSACVKAMMQHDL